MKSKVPDLHQVKPDIIVGTESWLTSDITNSEIFPKDLYTIYRKDRTGRKGGVFLAISIDILSLEQPELDTDCEIIWAKVDIIGVKSIYIGAYYKSQENDIESINELSRSLQRIPTNSHTWLHGDFNLPKYDWVKQEFKPNCKHLQQLFWHDEWS